MDPISRLPDPPVGMVVTPYDAAVAHWVFVTACVTILPFLAYALRDWQRSKSPLLPLILLGGALTNLLEPFVDITGGCWHPIIHQDTIFDIMGRPMPLWLLPTYVAYFGALPMCMVVAFRQQISKKAMWLWFIVPVIADIILEEGLFGVSRDSLYAYYGHQPLRLHVFPIWWSPANAVGVFLPAIALVLAAPHVRGWRLALVPLFTPLLYCGAGSLAAFPSSVVINSDFPYLVTQAGGVATFLLAGALAHVGVQLFAADSPWQIRDALGAGAAYFKTKQEDSVAQTISGGALGAGNRGQRGVAGNHPVAGAGTVGGARLQ